MKAFLAFRLLFAAFAGAQAQGRHRWLAAAEGVLSLRLLGGKGLLWGQDWRKGEGGQEMKRNRRAAFSFGAINRRLPLIVSQLTNTSVATQTPPPPSRFGVGQPPALQLLRVRSEEKVIFKLSLSLFLSPGCFSAPPAFLLAQILWQHNRPISLHLSPLPAPAQTCERSARQEFSPAKLSGGILATVVAGEDEAVARPSEAASFLPPQGQRRSQGCGAARLRSRLKLLQVPFTKTF